MKESLGLEKKTRVSKALAESSNFREKIRSFPDAPGQLHLPGTYQRLSRNLPPPISARDLLPPAQRTYHPKSSHPLLTYKCHLK